MLFHQITVPVYSIDEICESNKVDWVLPNPSSTPCVLMTYLKKEYYPFAREDDWIKTSSRW